MHNQDIKIDIKEIKKQNILECLKNIEKYSQYLYNMVDKSIHLDNETKQNILNLEKITFQIYDFEINKELKKQKDDGKIFLSNENIDNLVSKIKQEEMEENNNSIKTKMEIISINDKLSIHFLYVPKDYDITKLTFEQHKTRIIGRLNQFNRIKILECWKKDNVNLVKIFTRILQKRGWNFDLFPNPVAYISYYIEN
jgi:hypothetical protein